MAETLRATLDETLRLRARRERGAARPASAARRGRPASAAAAAAAEARRVASVERHVATVQRVRHEGHEAASRRFRPPAAAARPAPADGDAGAALREWLKSNAPRVMTLFRKWDTEGEVGAPPPAAHGSPRPRHGPCGSSRPRLAAAHSVRGLAAAPSAHRRPSPHSDSPPPSLPSLAQGIVDKDEFHNAMGALGLRAPPSEVSALFDEYDSGGVGVIKFSEMNSLLRRCASTHRLAPTGSHPPLPPAPPAHRCSPRDPCGLADGWCQHPLTDRDPPPCTHHHRHRHRHLDPISISSPSALARSGSSASVVSRVGLTLSAVNATFAQAAKPAPKARPTSAAPALRGSASAPEPAPPAPPAPEP